MVSFQLNDVNKRVITQDDTYFVRCFSARQGADNIPRQSDPARIALDAPRMSTGKSFDQVLSEIADGIQILRAKDETE